MKRFFRALAWTGMLVLIGLFPLWAASLRAARTNYLQEQYASWTGVLRVWRCEGWQSGSGSLTNWLNECIASFEKRHKGVYIQLIDVSEEELRTVWQADSAQPDLLIYAPGILEAPQGLCELTGEYALKDALSDVGMWQGQRYALPVALGGYALAVNSQLIPDSPADWGAVQMPQSSGKAKQTVRNELFDMPKDTDSYSWSAAVLALFAGNMARQGSQAVLIGEGIDLGLEDTEKEAPMPSEEVFLPDALPAPLPSNFGSRSSVYADFADGHLAMMPVTQREIRRLELLADSGKAPDWRIEGRGLPFTDQLALVSVTTGQGRSGATERQALCMELIDWMLSENMQKKLTLSRAFGVTRIAPLYSAHRAMGVIESSLQSEDLLVPPAFGNAWRTDAVRLLAEIEEGESTRAAYERLEQVLKKK